MKTCLVVDDSRVVRKVACSIVEGMGFVTLEAENGQEALKVCLEAMPDVILLDWNMPIMTGIEFLRALRITPHGLGPKVVFCTTENDMARIQEALEAGADEYIMKPFDADVMADKFQEIGI